MNKSHNFYAGPAVLPEEVIKEAGESVLSFGTTGLSILEQSHRSKDISVVMDEAVSLVKELLNISNDYAVLFLTGGASSQFFMSAMNLLNDDESAAYVDTGAWSTKAIKESHRYGSINVIASSKDQNYNYIPKGYEIPSDSKYLHLTSNNTIFGTQYNAWPDTDVPFVCDMSSDIFSRPIDVNQFDLIYAGAQKNLGPAGTTLVIVKKSVLGKVTRDIPTMLNYQTHIDKNSSFNTPPVFPIYVCMLTLRWLKKNGGVRKMHETNIRKAKLIYDAIDNNDLYNGTVNKEDRSLMNICFTFNDEELEGKFLEMCTNENCFGLKGHRSVGGFRASTYNALGYDSAKLLSELMNEFATKYG